MEETLLGVRPIPPPRKPPEPPSSDSVPTDPGAEWCSIAQRASFDRQVTLGSQQTQPVSDAGSGCSPSASPGSMLSMWLLKRRRAERPGSLGRALAGSFAQSICWKRRFFQVGRGKLLYWRSDSLLPTSKPRGVFPLAQIDEVACRGREVFIHFARGQRSGPGGRGRESLVLLAFSCADADAWAAAVCAAASVALRSVLALPVEWDIIAMLQRGCADGTRLVAKVPLDAQSVRAVQRLVDHAFIPKKTRDRDGYEMPLRLEVVDVVKVQNSATWGAYSKTRAAIASRVQTLRPLFPAVRTATTEGALIATLGDVDAKVAEHWLFHGTSSQAVQGITNTDFRLDLAGSHRGTLYGRGLYLAECSSKADEYATAESDGLCRMLLCRAVLGRMLVECARRPGRTEELEARCASTSPDSEYDSLCGDRLQAVGTYREFVVYNSGQVYPAYIIVYRRTTQAAFLGAIGKAAEAVSSEIAGGEEASNLEALVTHAACLAKRHPDSQTTYRILLLLSTHGGVIGPALTASLRSGSDHERRAIVRVLGLLGEHVSSGGVQGELHDSPVRTKVANDAVPALTACLDDDDARVRAAAADALRLFGQRAACAVPALVEALRDPVPIVRVASARGLGLLGRAEPEREALIVALSDECSDLRRAAAESLGRLCSRARCWENVPEAVPSLARCLEDADGQVRVAAAGALQKAGVHGVGAMLQLMRCLEDEHEGVREQAARALGEMGPAAAEAEQLLVGRLEDGHGAVRSAAATALGQLGERATPVLALKRCLGDVSNDVRKAAAASLGNLGAHAAAAVPALGRRLVDNDEEVRVTVALALGQLGQHASRALPALTERIKDPDINVRRAATMALVRMDPHASKASPALRELLADPSVQVREAAALVLRQASGTASRHASEPRSPCGADDAARASSDTSSDSGSGGGSSAGERSAGVSPEEDARGSAAV